MSHAVFVVFHFGGEQTESEKEKASMKNHELRKI